MKETSLENAIELYFWNEKIPASKDRSIEHSEISITPDVAASAIKDLFPTEIDVSFGQYLTTKLVVRENDLFPILMLLK